MSDKPWCGNIGEWGELYAACETLGAARLRIAEQSTPYVVTELTRPAHFGVSGFTIAGNDVHLHGSNVSYPRSLFADAARRIRGIISAKGVTKGYCADSDDVRFFKSLGFTQLSAGTQSHSDIHLKILRPDSIEVIQLDGYSIKTEAGALPTLYNMSNGRSLHYTVSGPEKQLSALQSVLLKGGRGRKKAMLEFAGQGGVITPGTEKFPRAVDSQVFSENLEVINPLGPELLAWAVRDFYFSDRRSCFDVANAVALLNPLNLSKAAYLNQYTGLWRALAMGLPSSAPFTGELDSEGGIIIVKDDFSIEAVRISRSVEDGLLRATEFDAPSFTRHIVVRGRAPYEPTSATTGNLELPWQIRWRTS